MRVTDTYPMLPNVCYHCRCANFPGVDLMRDDDDNPNRLERIYLCHKCLLHATRQVVGRLGLDIVGVDLLRQLAEDRDRAIAAKEAAEGERDVARAAVDNLVAMYGQPKPTSQIIDDDGGYFHEAMPAVPVDPDEVPPGFTLPTKPKRGRPKGALVGEA